MKYFDCHAHIILKQLFSDNPNVDIRISDKDVAGVPRTCSDLPNIIRTQIHQSQLASFNEEVIVGVVLYAAERHLAEEAISLQKLLKKGSQHLMSVKLLNDIRDNNFKSFRDFTLARTLRPILNAPQSFNILNKASFDKALPKNKVNVFFSIEGCHSLVDSVNDVSTPGKIYPPTEILTNLDALLKQINIVAINVTHLQQSSLCNHAMAIQLIRIEPFIPAGNGLTNDGRTVIQGLFDRGICVDLKHMSYLSRLQLRNEIDHGKYKHVQPVVCSHVGFTGTSFKQWPGYISLKKPVGNAVYVEVAKTMQVKNQPSRPGAPAFNMTTINLFDEEIVWVVKNKGIIGLIADRRILGYVSKFDERPTGLVTGSALYVDKEFMSKQEWIALGLEGRQLGFNIKVDDCVTQDDVEESAEGSLPARNEYFYDHFLLHLKHYLQVCIHAGISINIAQKHITIGSDYDGFINPFINIESVEEMASLKKYIKMNFRFYLRSLKDSKEWYKQLDVDAFAEDLFYNNGFNFIKQVFSKK